MATFRPRRRSPTPAATRDEVLLPRRTVLRGGAALAASALLSRGASALASPLVPAFAARRTQRVVLVVFGGGVRTRETLGSGNTPNLDRIAAEGVTFPSTAVRNSGHYGAAVSILTGSWEVFGIRENVRPAQPTLFEHLRKEAGLGPGDVWLSTAGSEQESNYAHSSHGSYGARYGANLIGGEGLFNEEFRRLLLGEAGRLPPRDEPREAALAAMRAAVRTPLPRLSGTGDVNDPETAARIEGYILDELRGGTSSLTGLGADDHKAMAVARNLLAVFRPRLLAITLRAADVAHGSYNDYVTVIRRNDEQLGQLFDAVRGDPELADSTAFFVLPEFGRDRDFNSRRGLDHGDTSDELLKVGLVAWGPDFRKGRVVSREVASIDVAPTIVSLFGGRMGRGTGRPLDGLFA